MNFSELPKKKPIYIKALAPPYDMCKAADRGMTITDVKLLEKHGGKSGSFVSD